MTRLAGRIFAVAAVVALLFALTAGAVAADQSFQDAGATQAQGGMLVSNDGRLTFTVPAAGFQSTDLVRIRYIPGEAGSYPNLPANMTWVGQPFTLELQDWNSGGLLFLNQTATMTIHYRPEDLGGRSPSWLRIVRFSDTWTDLPSTVDAVNHTVTAQVLWGGQYGLIAFNSQPMVPPAPVPTVPIPAPPPAPPTGNSSISGIVFFDKSGNGMMDDGDFPVANAGLSISSGTYYTETTTGPDGRYSFQGLPPGSYTVALIVGAQWQSTTPNKVTGIVVTGTPGSMGTANFGMAYKGWYVPY